MKITYEDLVATMDTAAKNVRGECSIEEWLSMPRTSYLLESCPGCGGRLTIQKCKALCRNEWCELFGRVIENCAGD